jgi:type I restriction enzyme R subunit
MEQGKDLDRSRPHQIAHEEEHLVDEAIHIDSVVQSAIASHSLDPENAISEIRKTLLPRYFVAYGGGMELAGDIIMRVLEIVRRGAGRDDS